MKQIIYLLTILLFSSCSQSNSGQKTTDVADSISTSSTLKDQNKLTEDKESKEAFRKQSLNDFDNATQYKLTDTISADFNGDGIADKAFYKKENKTSGIVIKHGNTDEIVRIGFGIQFAHMTEFNWVDYWGLVEDKETRETTFTEDGDVLDSKVIKLQNPSIVLGKDEVGGGVITFRNGKYKWIHQTC